MSAVTKLAEEATRKTAEAAEKKNAAQIKATEAAIKRMEEEIADLTKEHRANSTKADSFRWKDRGRILEEFIEGAKTLTDKQIKDFLQKTITTDFALRVLSEIKEPKAAEAKAANPPPQNASGEKPETADSTPEN